MTVISRTNHAFFFDGVSDSIVIPEGQFSALGHKTTDDTNDVRNILNESPHGNIMMSPSSGKHSNTFTIEAWIMPDCGGTIIEKEGQFKLSVGNVDTPGPAVFDVHLQSDSGVDFFSLKTATLESNRYEGTVYPQVEFGGIHDSYNRFNSSNDATDLNRNHRPLIHVVASVKSNEIALYVNGTKMVTQNIENTSYSMVETDSHVYIGGKGGQYRGVMEAVHLNAGFSDNTVKGNCPLPDDKTLLLYRFEEPIAPIEGVYEFSSIADNSTTVNGTAVTISQITLSVDDAKTLAKKLTGLETLTKNNYDFTSSPYSSGDYEVIKSGASSSTKYLIPHVPFNVLVNPGSISKNMKKPNQLPPERLRLHNVNVQTGNCLVSSIHLDFASSTNGLRKALHSRTIGTDNHFVIIGADLLIDSGTGKPYQPPHYSSQIIDRTGQMVIDEGDLGQHGFVYSSRMSTTTVDTNNPYAIVWPSTVDEAFQTGHSGRHSLNHVNGHEYLRMLPRANDEIIEQQVDGSADIIDVIYDDMQRGVDKQISVNSRVDVFREAGSFSIMNAKNSSIATAVFNSYHNTVSPPTGKRKLIAIGGVNFDFSPFILKGPSPAFKGTFDTDLRKFHLRPSKESRIALLKVPRLSVFNYAPFVEIHYNAIDLTGASMSTTVQPLLMVEKTVPSCDTLLSGSEYVYDAIADAISSGLTLYSPGGYIDVRAEDASLYNDILTSHSLVGDVSEGYSADDELDEALTPVNYTPKADANSIQNTTPQVIIESVSTTGEHESVFNRLSFSKTDGGYTLTDKGLFDRLEPDTVKSSPSAGEFDEGITSSYSPIHEMFDVIDNVFIMDSAISNLRIFIQPSDRRRTNQLQNICTSLNSSREVNIASLLYMMSRARVRGIEEGEGENANTIIRCIGLSESMTSRSINFTGKGSPDSHIVKEIEPNSPVVTVTLGGPGQGAIDTKPTYQKSMFTHAPYSIRRSYSVGVHKVDVNWISSTGTVHVKPLNNESPDLKSWGTYGFPRYGRIYFPDGSSAKYSSKTGTSFTFSVTTIGTGDYLSSDGTEYTAIGELLNATGLVKGVTTGSGTYYANFTIFNEPDFGEESELDNGSTVNDRMFQSMSDVSHDYQLGTQYASTRALVEIPFFSEQFFANTVGPENAFKIHIDATQTAHSYNPTPIGRRPKSTPPSDREAQSAYAYAIANGDYVASTFITKWDSAQSRLYLNDMAIFPPSSTTTATYQGITNAYRYRKVFLKNGEWAWYTNTNPITDGYLAIATFEYAHSKNFTDTILIGTPVFVGGPTLDNSLIPISSDEYTPSSDFEDRSEYYYDAASVKTQGGNVDYGLRQYVSAVEFKAGPESNPHAAKVKTGRAKGIVLDAKENTIDSFTHNSTTFITKSITITMSEEEYEKFPNLGYDVLKDAPSGRGQLFYEAQYYNDGTIYRFQYHGHIKNLKATSADSDAFTPENSITLLYHDASADHLSWETELIGKEITLTRRCRQVFLKQDSTYSALSYDEPLYRELYSNIFYDEQTVISSVNTTSNYIEITLPSSGSSPTKSIAVDLHNLNVKKGDIIYDYDDTANQITYIGVVSYLNLTDVQTPSATQRIYFENTPTNVSGGYLAIGMGDFEDKDAVLNAQWLNPYVEGGLRNGDAIWANMAYNNPHAVEGLFAKSRGVYNESQVWTEYNGGFGSLDATNPRDSIPLENFLIGNNCLETARNYTQHVNRTIEENYKALGLPVSKAPTVAYIDPYLAKEGHARVLLYDVAHDREFIAFQDLYMQVQSNAQTPEIGWPKSIVEDSAQTNSDLFSVTAKYNGAAPSSWTTQIDVANGFPSQNPYIRSNQQSKFIESAYAHDIANNHSTDLLDSTDLPSTGGHTLPDDGRDIAGAKLYGKAHGHHIHTGYSFGGTISGFSVDYSLMPRTEDSVALVKTADPLHVFSRIVSNSIDTYTKELVKLRNETSTSHSLRDPSTMFDTPDGTRVIPAYLCLKGIRASSLDLSSHEEGRLQHLPQWKDMDFVRRLSIDMGEVAQRDRVVDTLSAVEEIVRLINQQAALNAKFVHGSAHDPAPFWHLDNGDRGTHMGYIRAHIGREVQDLNGDIGYTVVIHSTVPGASGRNFCVWLDNSKGQATYQPQFLIGHGGRWRNFWALPDEIDGENMHPAPMPLNKDGKPFAPITTLQQYITSENSGEDIRSVAEFENDAISRGISNMVSGKNHNTVNDESFALKGSSSTIVKGLRVGTGAIGRVNFGGFVASGMPGWAPNAGLWGYGKKNESLFENRYGTSSVTSYTSHVTTKDVFSDNVGKGHLYGLQLENNFGTIDGLRYIYKRMGDSFANENTTLPSTIEEEICIFFDDRSVTQGGFTIGRHMQGNGDATGRMDFSSVSEDTTLTWKGGRWNCVPAPNIAMYCSLSFSSDTLTVTYKPPFDSSFTDDKLGYLGFPKENGVIQISDYDGTSNVNVGLVLSYTRRDNNKFYGITGTTTNISNGADYLITPVLNWTSLVTDELMAAVTAAAVNAGNEVNQLQGHSFDCRDMYASDGRTFGEWGVAKDAVKIRAYNPQKFVTPLNEKYYASLHRDFGIKAAHLEFGEIEKSVRPTGTADWDFGTSRAITDANIDAGREIDCGYLPYTVLQLRTISKGSKSNTATPIIVDSNNSPIDIKKWREGLKGIRYTRNSGDHILPKIENPMSIYTTTTNWTSITQIEVDNAAGYPEGYAQAIATDAGNPSTSLSIGDTIADAAGRVLGQITATTTTSFTIGNGLRYNIADDLAITQKITNDNLTKNWQTGVTLGADMFSFLIPANNDTTSSRISSFGEKKRIYLKDNASIHAESKVGSTSVTELIWDIENAQDEFSREITFNNNPLSTYFNSEFEGLRSIGSVFSEPLVYFRGGKDSIDHSVPLFFGGGFSGVVLDINDGTNNDYSTFYTHPYANGPTGTAGIQNANEISTSYAILDCNAMFAFFPGAALCNQHRGSISPPAFNKNNILSPDVLSGGSSEDISAKPIPLVMRFAHPTARYDDHRDSSIENKTTYLIFGPGQAFPFTQEVSNAASGHNTLEPFSGRIIVDGNNWSSVPSPSSGDKFPNSIRNDNGDYKPFRKTHYNDRAGFHWRAVVNWETPAGFTNKGKYQQRAQHGRMYGQILNSNTPYDASEFNNVQPRNHTPLIGFGITMAADTVWHMDGGFHAGGHWMDNQYTNNPPHPTKTTRVSSSDWERSGQLHPTAFRTAGVMTNRILDYIGGSETIVNNDVDSEYVIIDATRCQNGEEFAATVGAAINAFPGAGALKVIGGTHTPSMGNANQQDRYGWVDLGTVGTYTNTGYPSYVESAAGVHTQSALEQIPSSGWLRVDTAWAVYHSREIIKSGSDWKARFFLASNRIRGNPRFENGATWSAHITTDTDNHPSSVSGNLYVWSKAGVIRFNNENDSARDHMTQVHFSGIVNAIDRTLPKGAVGWHGERYSYLNSLKITTTTTKNTVDSTTTGYAAGLGAWHPMLGFSPYGSSSSILNVHSNIPVIAPMKYSPESAATIDGMGDYLPKYIKKTYLNTNYNLASNTRTFNFKNTDDMDENNLWNLPTNYVTNDLPQEFVNPQGLYSNAYLAISYESESALIAKYDRDGITAIGDWLHVIGQSTNPIQYAGTTQWDERFHDQDRFIAPATAGPNIEALIVDSTSTPTGNPSTSNWSDTTFTNGTGSYFHSTTVTDDLSLKNAVPGLNKVGDLLFDLDYSVGSVFLESGTAERNVSKDRHTGTAYTASGSHPNEFWMSDVNAYDMYSNSASKNFTIENVVWKRMDGGNLSLPSINARGLGAVPWQTRVSGSTAYQTGEKIFGNVRFTFETTNSAMLPVLQAQELSHPQLMRKYPYKIGNVLEIPNEEIQFQSISVTDDTGEIHVIEGGSPFGTIVRGFRTPENRKTKGPALANSSNIPNLKIQLPNPNSIPGNIVVRSGFDPLQAYQNETMGSGGMIHPDLNESYIGHLYDGSTISPRTAPMYENHNWEKIEAVTYDSTTDSWENNAPIQTSYELHDRTLFFHVCKMGHGFSHRYPNSYSHSNGLETNILTVSSWSSPTLTVNTTINTNVFASNFGSKEKSDNRRFIRIYNVNTDEGVVASYTGISGTTFTGVVGDVDFSDFIDNQTLSNLRVVPSYYIPAGSNRFFAARRLRDHTEVSGNSPDMAHTRYFAGDTIAYNAYSKPLLTPMPYPRMGHHFVTPTMPMLPGHWAHPAYQSVYKRHLLDFNVEKKFIDSDFFNDYRTPTKDLSDMQTTLTTNFEDNFHPLDVEINFGSLNSTLGGPSDIHGGAFTLMFETGLQYDGYGVLASSGEAGNINKAGGHTVVLEAAANYTLEKHFPDPAEVGAYQIVIQPNLYSSQIIGYHANSTVELTSQQINTVIGIKRDSSRSTKIGGLALILAKAVQADVRGCEVFINEMILDVNPDFGSQFTNIPPLMLRNAWGIQMNESPSFTRRGFAYSSMFNYSTPGLTLQVPWWSILHKNGVPSSTFRKLTQSAPDNYYMYMKNGFGTIGNQQNMLGYSSTYTDIYSKLLHNVSMNPKCTVISFNSGGGTITVDDATLFPINPHYQQVIEYTGKDGKRYSKTLTKRSGNDAGNVNIANTLYAASGSDGFWTNLYDGAIIRLSEAYDVLPAGDVFTNTKKSIFANILPELIEGNRDTFSNHIPDAYLCMWHPNLGRPNTYFSDSRSTWQSNAVDKDSYNSLPEHFETVHYHDFTYSASMGPFDFLIKTPSSVTKSGTVVAGDSTHDAGGNNVMLSGFWPCGSRGGPQISKLEMYAMATASWNVHSTTTDCDYSSNIQNEWVDLDDDGNYAVNLGLDIDNIESGRRIPYGYRNAVRQAYNKPRYELSPVRAQYETTPSGSGVKTTDYNVGPLVQIEKYSSDWTYSGGKSGISNDTFPITYVGVMERQTNFTGMLNQDQEDWQVRYSDGRRMTRPFGAPVRSLRNPNGVERDWWGDIEGKGITSLSEGSEHHLVDWWGNTRGEAVRRAPVRGFGIRPAWDCGNAYENDRTNGWSAYRRIWNNGKPIFNLKGIANLSTGNISVTTNYTIPRFGGVLNDSNNNNSNDLVDVFAPTRSLRVGDMGNGRGVRYPTKFNEDVLTELSSPIHKTGIVLSTNTAEPLFGDGLLRPRNAILQADEVKRGISSRLGIDDNGLLKSEAVVSDRVEEISGSSPHKDAISRTSPRIGIDAENIEGIEQNHIIINTEAHSLHTDRNVGQRVVLHGALQVTGSLSDADYTSIVFNRQTAGSPINAVQRFSHTNPFRPYGGTYVIEAKNYAGLFDDTGWGVSSLTGSNDTSNPYQHPTNYNSNSVRNNEKDKSVKLLLRPIRLLDGKHVEIFRIHNSLHSSSPQYVQNYLFATSGGKYGIYNYEVANGRTEIANISSGRGLPDGNGPYTSVFVFDSTGDFTTPLSYGPKLPGTETSGFDKESLSSTVTRLVITENTLQHHRSDAARRKTNFDTDDEQYRPDFDVKPRFSQSLHSKGHKGDVSFNITNHSGDGA